MGLGTVTHLLSAKPGSAMAESLKMQKAEYTSVARQAELCLRQRGEQVKGLNFLEKKRTDLALSANLLARKDDRHMAQMLMTGAVMGVINAQKKITESPDADSASRDLMKRLSDFEEQTIQKMKPFL